MDDTRTPDMFAPPPPDNGDDASPIERGVWNVREIPSAARAIGLPAGIACPARETDPAAA